MYILLTSKLQENLSNQLNYQHETELKLLFHYWNIFLVHY